MFVGHYSVSFAAKAVDRKIPLWLLFLAVQLVDVLWAIFVMLGIEKVRIAPGITASNPLDLYYMPYTHSLVGALGWSALAFLLCQLFSNLKGRRTGLILALAASLARELMPRTVPAEDVKYSLNLPSRLLKNSNTMARSWKSGPLGPRKSFRICRALAPVTIFHATESSFSAAC